MDNVNTLARIELVGPPLTGPLSSGNRHEKRLYKERIRYAARNCRCRKPIDPEAPLSVRITAYLRRGQAGDCDNIAKPILDSLHDLLGEDSCGRSRDERVKRLEVNIRETTGGQRVIVEIGALH